MLLLNFLKRLHCNHCIHKPLWAIVESGKICWSSPALPRYAPHYETASEPGKEHSRHPPPASRHHHCDVMCVCVQFCQVSMLMWPQPGHEQHSHHWGPELPVVAQPSPSTTPTPDFYSLAFQNAMWMESVCSFLKGAFFTWDDSSVTFQAVAWVNVFSLLLTPASGHGGAMISLTSHLWMDTWIVSSLCS